MNEQKFMDYLTSKKEYYEKFLEKQDKIFDFELTALIRSKLNLLDEIERDIANNEFE